MNQFIYVSTILSSVIMLAFLLIRYIRNKSVHDFRMRAVLVCSAVSFLNLMISFISGSMRCPGIVSVLLPPCMMMLVLSYPYEIRHVRRSVRYVFVFQSSVMICHLAYAAGFVSMSDGKTVPIITAAAVMIFLFMDVSAHWDGIRDMRVLMKSGTVWHCLELTVKEVYVKGMTTVVSVQLLSFLLPGLWHDLLQISAVVLTVLLCAALCIRSGHDAVFVLARDRERRILESLKISQMEMSGSNGPDLYRELYERIVAYFEEAKPYLDHDLTINDVSKVVFSNRLYISKAINRFTGRNFCQFVNYYRISYSLECFRSNPSMRISEMAEASGFNSVVSYNMAFRLFMNESPGDWCRKERYKIHKEKK